MTAPLLVALDLLLTVVGTVAFFGAAVLALSARRTVALATAVPAGLCVAGRVVVAVALGGHGWWFVADKVLVGLPLAVAAATFGLVIAVPAGAGAGRRAAAGLFVAGYGSAAGLLVTFVVGFPVDLGPAVAVAALVAGVSGLTWLGLTGSASIGSGATPRRRPGLTAALTVLCLVPALVSAAPAFYRQLSAVVVGAGGGHHPAAAPGVVTAGPVGADAVSVADLRTGAEPGRPPRRFNLSARQQQVTLSSGAIVDGWTFGSLPGPELRVRQGDLVEVTLVNVDIADGVTLHWHGYRVPNGEDGVAGVTQDAVAPGRSFTYRFVAADPGTYWYHAHQVSAEAVQRGLFGALVVEPSPTAGAVAGPVTDLVVPVHTVGGIPLVGDTDGVLSRPASVGASVLVRLINTDPEPHRISVTGTDVTVAAVDGTDLVGPTPIGGRILRLPAGGRYDVTFQMPDGPVTFGLEGAPATGLRLVPPAVDPAGEVAFVDGPDLDLLTYGRPSPVPGVTGSAVTREATLVLDRQFRFLDGVPTLAQTVNGEVHPFVPPIEVDQGDLLRLTVVNRSSETHPMHPHGHRVLVESRSSAAGDAEPIAGTPLWLDTFDVRPGEVWTVLLRADNPGIWMAHCHNLEHATEGMVVHLTYRGVSTPYTLGGGPADNRPE